MNEEPKLPEDWQSDILGREAAARWIEWAKLEIEVLRTSILATGKCHEEERVLAWQRIADMFCMISEQEAKLKEQEEAIKGFETWMRLRKNSVETYEIGATVVIGPDRIQGKITSIVLYKGRTEYGVSYWVNRLAVHVFVPSEEVELFDDPLPRTGSGT